MSLLLALLAFLGIPPEATCTASIFGHRHDRWAQGRAVCLHRHVRESDVGVAHRTLPCGTRIFLYLPRTGKHALAHVIDRGPYGAVDLGGRWFLKRHRRGPGRYRGCLDLAPATARALGHNGLEQVAYQVIIR